MLRILVLLICVCPSLGSAAQEQTHPPVVRVAAGMVTPWVYRDDDGRERGVLIDFSQALASYTDMPHVNVLQPYPRALQSLVSGYVDIAVAFQSPTVGKTAILVGGLSRSRVLMVARANDAEHYRSEPLAGVRVGYIRGSDYDLARRDMVSANHLFPVNNMYQGLELLVKNRLDVMVGTEEAFTWAIREMELGSDELGLIRVLGEAGVGLYLSKKSTRQELIEVYRQALSKMRQDGKLESIFKFHSAFDVDALK